MGSSHATAILGMSSTAKGGNSFGAGGPGGARGLASRHRRSSFLQLGVFGIGLPKDRDVQVGGFPATEELLVVGPAFRRVSGERKGSSNHRFLSFGTAERRLRDYSRLPMISELRFDPCFTGAHYGR